MSRSHLENISQDEDELEDDTMMRSVDQSSTLFSSSAFPAVTFASVWFRVALPLALFVSFCFRYSLVSFLYLLFFLVLVRTSSSSSSLQSQRPRIALVTLLVVALLSLLAEIIFNVLLSTGTVVSISSTEDPSLYALLSTLGLEALSTSQPLLFFRLLFPDLLVLLMALLSLCMSSQQQQQHQSTVFEQNDAPRRVKIRSAKESSSSERLVSSPGPLSTMERQMSNEDSHQHHDHHHQQQQQQLYATPLLHYDRYGRVHHSRISATLGFFLLTLLAATGSADPSFFGAVYVLMALAAVAVCALLRVSVASASFSLTAPCLVFSALHLLVVYAWQLPITQLTAADSLLLQHSALALGLRSLDPNVFVASRDWPAVVCYLCVVLVYVVATTHRHLIHELVEWTPGATIASAVSSLPQASDQKKRNRHHVGRSRAVQQKKTRNRLAAGGHDSTSTSSSASASSEASLINVTEDDMRLEESIEEGAVLEEATTAEGGFTGLHSPDSPRLVTRRSHWTSRWLAFQGHRFVLVCVLLLSFFFSINVIWLLVLLWSFLGPFFPVQRFVRSAPLPLALCFVSVVGQYVLAINWIKTPVKTMPVVRPGDWIEALGFGVPEPAALVSFSAQLFVLALIAAFWRTRNLSSEIVNEQRARSLLSQGKKKRKRKKKKNGADESTQETSEASVWSSRAFLIMRQLARIAWSASLALAGIAFRYAYFISLVALYVVAVHYSGLIQLVYLLFFIIFFLSERLASKYWVLLLGYVELAIVAQLSFQMDWSESLRNSVWADTVGLRYFGDSSGELILGLLWDLVLLLCVSSQWQLNKHLLRKGKRSASHERQYFSSSSSDDDEEEEHDDVFMSDSNQKDSSDGGGSSSLPHLGIARFFNVSSALLPHWLPPLALYSGYALLATLALFEDASLRTAISLLLLLSCGLAHLMVRGAVPRLVSLLWSLLVFWTGLSLTLQYVWQLDALRIYLLNQWPASAPISPAEVGLFLWPPGISSPARVFGTALVFAVTALIRRLLIWRRRLLSVSAKLESLATLEDATKALTLLREGSLHELGLVLHTGRAVARFCQRLWLLQHARLLAVVLFVAAITPHPYAVSLPFLLCSVLSVMSPAFFLGQLPVLVLYSYAALIAVAQLCSRLSLFNTLYERDEGRLALYLGFERTEFQARSAIRYVLVCLALVAARFGLRWLKDVEANERYSNRCEIPLLRGSGRPASEEDSDPETSAAAMTQNTATWRWHLNNVFVLYGNFVLLTGWLVAVYLQANATGLFYLLLLGLFVGLRRSDRPGELGRLSLFLVSVFSSIILLIMGVIWLGPPPLAATGVSEWPWSEHFAPDLLAWLSLAPPLHYSFDRVLSGFFVVLLLARAVGAVPKRVRSTALQRSHQQSQTAEWLTAQPRSAFNRAREGLYTFSSFLVLLLVFIAGTAKADLLSLVYVAFSLYFLIRSNNYAEETADSDRQSIRFGWSALRWFSYALLVAKVAYQAPFFPKPPPGAGFSVQVLIGLYSFQRHVSDADDAESLTTYFDATGLLFDMIIFISATWQLWLMGHNEARQVAEHRRRQEALKFERAVALFRSRREAQIKAIIEQGNRSTMAKKRLAELQRAKLNQGKVTLVAPHQSAPNDDDVEGSEEELSRATTTESSDAKSVPTAGIGVTATAGASSAAALRRDQSSPGTASLSFWRRWLLWIKSHDWTRAVSELLEQYSQTVCFIVMAIAHAVSADLLSIVYPLSAFGYAALIEVPRPGHSFWNSLLVYVVVVICAKFLFQINLFCECSASDGLRWSVHPFCPGQDDACDFASGLNEPELGWPRFTGIYKIEGISFLRLVASDLIVLVAVLWHRRVARYLGVWRVSRASIAKQLQQVQVRDSDRLEAPMDSDSDQDMLENEQTATFSSSTPSSSKEKEESQSSLNSASFDKKIAPASPIHSSTTMEGQTTSVKTAGDERTKRRKRRRKKAATAEDEEREIEMEEDDDAAAAVAEKAQRRHDSSNGGPSLSERADRWLGGARKFLIEVSDWRGLKLGRDFYPAILLVEVLALIWLVLFPQSFVGLDTEQLVKFLQTSSIPASFLFVVLSQFTWIVLERIVYVRRAMKAKVVIQAVTLLLYLFLLFFYYPPRNASPFARSAGLVGFYLLKCTYWLLSAMQICYGYPSKMQVGRQFLTRSPSSWRYVAFSVYRAVPFVFELRVLLDWTLSDTTLVFYQWLKVQDVYSQLYLVSCKREAERRDRRRLGQIRPLMTKLVNGMLLFLVLCFVLWFPLFFFSNVSLSSEPNDVQSCRTTAGLSGWDSFFSLSQSAPRGVRRVTTAEFDSLRRDVLSLQPEDERLAQVLTTSSYSDRTFELSPPSRLSLQRALESPESMPEFFLSFELSMRLPAGSSPVTFSPPRRPLGESEKAAFASALERGNGTVPIADCFPRIFRVPAPGLSVPYVPVGVQSVGCQLILDSTGGDESAIRLSWFSLNQNISSISSSSSSRETSPSGTAFNSTGLQIVILSDPIAVGLASALASAGVIGLYITLVLSIGRFLRMYVSGLTLQIIYEDMGSAERLLQLLDDMFLARDAHDFVLEEQLYYELIEIYRSPESLIQWTDKIKLKKE